MTTYPNQDHTPSEMTLPTLIEECQRAQSMHLTTETDQSADAGACFELLRRGLEEDEAGAWQAFEEQFSALFYHWLQQDLNHFGLQWNAVDELEELWAEARSRFVTRYARLQTLSDNFSHIGAVLKVIQKCIRSTVQEQRRCHDRQQRLITAIEDLSLHWADASGSEWRLPSAQVELDELRRCITAQLEQDVPEAELRQLLYWRYVDDLKPREISAHYPDAYPNTDAVHRALERIMKRLRRRVDQYVLRCL